MLELRFLSTLDVSALLISLKQLLKCKIQHLLHYLRNVKENRGRTSEEAWGSVHNSCWFCCRRCYLLMVCLFFLSVTHLQEALEEMKVLKEWVQI